MPTPSASNRSSIAFGGNYASIVLWFGKLRRVGGSSGFIRRRRRTGRADGLRRRQHPVSPACDGNADRFRHGRYRRSEAHTSELQSLMRLSNAVFCVNKKIERTTSKNTDNT